MPPLFAATMITAAAAPKITYGHGVCQKDFPDAAARVRVTVAVSGVLATAAEIDCRKDEFLGDGP